MGSSEEKKRLTNNQYKNEYNKWSDRIRPITWLGTIYIGHDSGPKIIHIFKLESQKNKPRFTIKS